MRTRGLPTARETAEPADYTSFRWSDACYNRYVYQSLRLSLEEVHAEPKLSL